MFDFGSSYNHGHTTKTRHRRTIVEWVVYRKCGDGLEYWNGDGWTMERNLAKGFDDVSSANRIAERLGGKAVKR